MSETIQIGLYDSCPTIRTGLKHILSSEPKFTNVLEIERHEDILEKFVNVDLDILLLDVDTLHDLETELELLKKYRQLRPGVKLVIFTACNDCAKIMQIVQVGIQGFKLKSAEPEEIIECLHTVLQGGTDLDARVSSALMEHMMNQQTDSCSSLSNREEEVLDLLSRGKSNNDIADRLSITPRTVKYHVSSIFSKLNVKNRTEAAAKWIH